MRAKFKVGQEVKLKLPNGVTINVIIAICSGVFNKTYEVYWDCDSSNSLNVFSNISEKLLSELN